MQLVILVGCKDERQLFRFPSDEGEFHGFNIFYSESDDRNQMVRNYAAQQLNIPTNNLKIHTIINPGLKSRSGAMIELAILEVLDGFRAPFDWLPLPHIIRSMAKSSNRLVYGKALQVFSGALVQETDALEIDEEVRERLRQLADQDESDSKKSTD